MQRDTAQDHGQPSICLCNEPSQQNLAGGREVLKNISLSFLPGAKIGVLGLNGAGKSTLLRIMAGIETEFQGEAWA